MQRNWTSVGLEHVPVDQRELVGAIFDRMEWQAVPVLGDGELRLGAMPAECLSTMINELHITRVSHVAVSHEMAPCGLVAARGHYRNGRADVYALDLGHEAVVLCSDFYEGE